MISLVTDLNDLTWIKLAVWTIGIALGLWLCVRSGSLHVALELVWRLLHGSRRSETRRMAAFYQKRTALMHFRWNTNIRVRTLREAKALVEWCRAYDEEIADVHACGQYFDPGRPGLRVAGSFDCHCEVKKKGLLILPGWPLRSGLIIFFALACLLVCLAAVFATISGAIVSVKHGSGIWLVLYPDHFSLLHGIATSFISGDCKNPEHIAKVSGLPLKEVHIACEWLSDPARMRFVTKNVMEQRSAAIIAVLLFAWLAYSTLRWLRAIFATEKMCRRLESNKSGGAESTLASRS